MTSTGSSGWIPIPVTYIIRVYSRQSTFLWSPRSNSKIRSINKMAICRRERSNGKNVVNGQNAVPAAKAVPGQKRGPGAMWRPGGNGRRSAKTGPGGGQVYGARTAHRQKRGFVAKTGFCGKNGPAANTPPAGQGGLTAFAREGVNYRVGRVRRSPKLPGNIMYICLLYNIHNDCPLSIVYFSIINCL